jgi:galactose mutarotase-like enzyme
MDNISMTFTPSAATASRATSSSHPSCQVSKKILSGGRSEGVELIEIDNGRLKLALLPQRGMGIWKAWLDGIEFGWKSPVSGPVHPALVPIADPSGLGWLEGFDELLCRCGLSSNGAPDFDERGTLRYPLHGRIANLPAEAVEISHDAATGAVSVTGIVRESRFHFHNLRLRSTLTLHPGEATFRIHDEITNLSARPATVQLMYHYNLGTPLLGPGASVVAPVKTVVPRNARAAEGIAHWQTYDEASATYTEQVYFADMHADEKGQTLALLKNAGGDLGASVRFNTSQLPYLVVWKNTVDHRDGYVTGIEPSTNFPNPHTFEAEKGRVIHLAAEESVRFDLQFAFHTGSTEIDSIETEISRLQGVRKSSVLERPLPDWCCY